jgi:hypothetical protein
MRVMSTLDRGGPMVARTKSRSRKDRRRARTGPVTWARRAGGVASNHSQKPFEAFGVGQVGGEGGAELLVVQQRWHGEQGGVGVAHHGQAGHAHDVIDARPPVALEDRGEDRDDVVDDEVFVAAWANLERVERGAPGGLIGVDDHEPLERVIGDAGLDVAGEVAFGVDEDDASAGVDVVED